MQQMEERDSFPVAATCSVPISVSQCSFCCGIKHGWSREAGVRIAAAPFRGAPHVATVQGAKLYIGHNEMKGLLTSPGLALPEGALVRDSCSFWPLFTIKH